MMYQNCHMKFSNNRTFGGVQDVINSTYIQIRNNSK